MAFDNQSVYSKHQKDCGCSTESDCSCSSSDNCGCCPPGLVAVYDSCGVHSGCLTPNDAACYEVAKNIPVEGYVKLYNPITGVFLGVVTPSEALAMLSALDSSIVPPTAGSGFNPSTVMSAEMSAAPIGETNSAQVEFAVDRITCADPITASISTPPAGFSFIGGASTIVIPSGASSLIDGIEVTDAVVAGSYNLMIQYSGCSISKTKVIQINVL